MDGLRMFFDSPLVPPRVDRGRFDLAKAIAIRLTGKERRRRGKNAARAWGG